MSFWAGSPHHHQHHEAAKSWFNGQAPHHIHPTSGVADHSLLSVTSDGSKVDLYHTDDESGRQKWFLNHLYGNTYHILIAGGISNNRRYLSVTSDGSKVDLYHEDDNSGRQKWNLEPLGNNAFHVFISGGVNPWERRYLSCTADGRLVDLYSQDDNSGRQKWMIYPFGGKPAYSNGQVTVTYAPSAQYQPAVSISSTSYQAPPVPPPKQLVYNMRPVGHEPSKLLSVPSGGEFVDLYHVDDLSGRQRWVFIPVGGPQYNIKIYAGMSNDRVFLSTTDDGTKVDMYRMDDASGRQRWMLEPVGPGQYHLVIAGGVRDGRKYLSVNPSNGRMDLVAADDNSGRQRWVLTPLQL